MAESFLIWGAGGQGLVTADIIRALGATVSGFVDDDPTKIGAIVDGMPVVCTGVRLLEQIKETGQCPEGATRVAVAVGDNAARQRIFEKLGKFAAPALIHPKTTISSSAQIGAGTCILPGAVVNAHAVVGPECIVNTAAVIEHECQVGRAVHLSPGVVLCGLVRVGARAWIGANAVVLPGITIGQQAMVGAGSVVVKDVADDTTVAGNPAGPLSK